jgi:SpoVK/Ycf46/Vps4 family AAA+-type ATPase
MNCSLLIYPIKQSASRYLSIELVRRKRNPAELELERIAAAAKGYSGAEIAAAVQSALYAAFSQKELLTTQFLLDALAQTVPLSTARSEEIDTLREWAKTRAVPASAGNASG